MKSGKFTRERGAESVELAFLLWALAVTVVVSLVVMQLTFCGVATAAREVLALSAPAGCSASPAASAGLGFVGVAADVTGEKG